MRRRRHELDKYDYLYAERGRSGDPCTYCGVTSTGYDHIPPMHHVARLVELGAEPEGSLRKVPACSECNTLLAGTVLLTLAERRQHLKKMLRKKYKSYCRMPRWDEEEIEELGRGLSDSVRQASSVAESVKARLGYWRR